MIGRAFVQKAVKLQHIEGGNKEGGGYEYRERSGSDQQEKRVNDQSESHGGAGQVLRERIEDRGYPTRPATGST